MKKGWALVAGLAAAAAAVVYFTKKKEQNTVLVSQEFEDELPENAEAETEDEA